MCLCVALRAAQGGRNSVHKRACHGVSSQRSYASPTVQPIPHYSGASAMAAMFQPARCPRSLPLHPRSQGHIRIAAERTAAARYAGEAPPPCPDAAAADQQQSWRTRCSSAALGDPSGRKCGRPLTARSKMASHVSLHRRPARGDVGPPRRGRASPSACMMSLPSPPAPWAIWQPLQLRRSWEASAALTRAGQLATCEVAAHV